MSRSSALPQTRALLAAMIALGALTLSACAPEEAGPVDGLPNFTAEPTPTETQGPPAWFYEENIMERSEIPAELVAFRDMSLDDFERQPMAEQWRYVSWLTQYRSEFMAWSFTVSSADSNEPVVVTADSPTADLLRDLSVTLRLASYATAETPVPRENGTCGRLDEDAVRKITAAATGGGFNASQLADAILAYNNGQSTCPSRSAVRNFFDFTSGVDVLSETRGTEGFGGQVATIVRPTFTLDGVTREPLLYVVSYTTFDGQPAYATVLLEGGTNGPTWMNSEGVVK